MNYHNYKIKAKKGKFYLSSPDKIDGYYEVQTDKFGVRYHKDFESITGTFNGVELSNPPYGGEDLKIYIQESSDTLGVLSIPCMSGDEIVDRWAIEFVKVLPNLEIGQEVKLSLNQTKKDSEGYLYRNVYISVDGTNVPWAIKWEEAPAPIITVSKVKKTEKKDYTPVNEFWYSKIQEQCERLAPQRRSAAPETVAPTSGSEAESPDDDLPF